MATNNKYDRQLRLWGSQGQRKLAESQILLLGASPAGVETIKNLVLPGCGHITVVDDLLVTERDLGNNFFCAVEHLNQSRAMSVTENLVEMNPDDVKGKWIQENPSQKAQDENFVKQFNIVIANELLDSSLQQLSQICSNNSIKLLAIQTNGFYGQLSLQGNHHCIIESKLERNFFDWSLRIREPFATLKEFAQNFDIEDLATLEDKSQMAHIPFLVILISAVAQWRSANDNKFPQSQEEKGQVKEIIRSQMNKLEAKDRENFEEGLDHLYWAFKDPRALPDNLETLFNYQYCTDLKLAPADDVKFWAMIAALKVFRERNDNFLPVDRKVPDMKSTTDWFIQLKEVYTQQHNLDKQKFIQILKEFNNDLVFNDAEDIQPFLDNIYFIQLEDFRPISAQLSAPQETENYENNCHLWWVGQRSVNQFHQNHGRFPNPADIEELTSIAQKIRETQFSNYVEIDQSIVKEFCRYEDTKLHNIAAILGGVASQEAIKLITNQFTPINNTFIFNGTSTESVVLEF